MSKTQRAHISSAACRSKAGDTVTYILLSSNQLRKPLFPGSKANPLTEKTALACSLYGEKITEFRGHHTVLVAHISKRIDQSSECMTSKENGR